MDEDYLTQSVIDTIIDRYEMDEILDILNMDAESLCRILSEQILEVIEKFDVPIY